MFDAIYDNGAVMLGKVANVIAEVQHEIDIDLDMVFTDKLELLEDLKEIYNEDKDAIVCINYENPMGYSIIQWTYDDIINKP